MTIRRRLHAAVVCALCVLCAGCGGARAGTGATLHAAGTDGGAAAAMPHGTLLFAETSLDADGAAWRSLDRLGVRVPHYAELRDRLLARLRDRATLAAPALASTLSGEVAFGALSVGPSPVRRVVAYLACGDEDGARAALRASGRVHSERAGLDVYASSDGSAFAVGNGAILYASDRASLQALVEVAEGGRSLADQQAFRDAVAALPGDRDEDLAVAYLDASLAGVLATPMARDSLVLLARQLAASRGLALALHAADAGLRLDVAGHAADGADVPPDAPPALLAHVPEDAMAAGDTHDTPGIVHAGGLESQLDAFADAAQVTRGDVRAALGGEVAGFVMPVGDIAVGQLFAAAADPALAERTLHALAQGQNLSVDSDGSVVTVTYSSAARPGARISVERLGGHPLPASRRFSDLRDAAGVPDAVSSLLYLRLPAAGPLLGFPGKECSQVNGRPASCREVPRSAGQRTIQEVLDHLGGLLFATWHERDVLRAAAFVAAG